MASSSGTKVYPPRLYPEGKSPLQNRSMNHYCFLNLFGRVKDGIGADVFENIKETSQVGVILKLADMDFVSSSNLLHNFLTRQLSIENGHEIWILIGGQPIRFSLHEFSDITGLNCDRLGDDDEAEIDDSEFWKELRVSGGGPKFKHLEALLSRCRTWSFEKRKMIGLLCILSIGILGISQNSRIPMKYAKMVLDLNAFERFPWGRVGFESIINSIKIVCFEKTSYVVHGCVHALVIWGYESLPFLAEKFGDRNEAANVVPLLRYKSSRKRFNFDAYVLQEKQEHGRVRVRHMVDKEEENLLPSWPDENMDCSLKNLVGDIKHGRLDVSFWDVPSADKGTSEKAKSVRSKSKKGNDSDDDFVDKVPQKKRVVQEKKNKRNDEEEAARKDGKKIRRSKGKEIVSEEETEDDSDVSVEAVKKKKKGHKAETGVNSAFERELWSSGLVSMIETLSSKVDAIDNKFSSKFDQFDSKFASLDQKIRIVESDVTRMKQARAEDVADAAEDGKSATRNGDDVGDENNEQSWVLKMKDTSEDSFQVACLVRNPKATTTTPREIKKEPEEKTPKSGKACGSLKKKEPKDTVDSKKNELPAVNLSEGSESFGEEPKRFGVALDKLLALSKRDDCVMREASADIDKRHISLAASQRSPYIGNSGVKRVMFGCHPSDDSYDPFEKVLVSKVEKLMAFLDHDMNNPLPSSNADSKFYLTIRTPKELWPKTDNEFGWLGDMHLCSAMHMLRRRSMRDRTPFRTDRIAFLDPWF
ncbi:hypothetical protein EUTSA_v10029261mg, partial [Eutrema salsugineum]